MQGTAQLTNFVGPILAGGLIALFSSTSAGTTSVGMTGIALAFGLDALDGLIIKFSLEGLFIGAGMLMVAMAGWIALNRDARAVCANVFAPSAAD